MFRLFGVNASRLTLCLLALIPVQPCLPAATRETGRPLSNEESTALSPRPDALKPLALEDLMLLAKVDIGAGILVRQIRARGIAFLPSVENLIRLRRAGAGDPVLEAVLDAAERGSSDHGEAAPPGADCRIFAGTDGAGRRVLVLTNLDDHGLRIGGESVDPRPSNIVASGDPRDSLSRTRPGEPTPEEEPSSRCEGRARAEGSCPCTDCPTVVVEVPAPALPAQPAACGSIGSGPWVTGCNLVATGGVVGAFHYPEKLWFLGYGPDSGPVNPSFGAGAPPSISPRGTPPPGRH